MTGNYMDRLGEIIRGYQTVGVVPIGLVPKYVTDSNKYFVVAFRHAGELHTCMGDYAVHMMVQAQLSGRPRVPTN